MKNCEFSNRVDEIFKICKEVLTSKGDAYARDDDRFANFNRLAEQLVLPRTTIWKVYFQKHMDAIESYMAGYRGDPEKITSRFVDAINYLLLLYGMLIEDENERDINM